MIQAYDKNYLEKTRILLACMLDYSCNCLNFNLECFYSLFLYSTYVNRIEKCDISINIGKSGIELSRLILEEKNIEYKENNDLNLISRSKEYWCGYNLAYLQWISSLSFRKINKYISITEIVKMYDVYHEMDVNRFCFDLINIYNSRKKDTNLKLQRNLMNLSQNELAIKSGVSLRTIQQYEQEIKNINKANGETLIKLSNVLCCEAIDLFEIKPDELNIKDSR